MKKDFQKLYEECHSDIKDLIETYKIKYSTEELLNTFTDLYINILDKDEVDLSSEKKPHANFRLIGSQPDDKGKKKIQLVRFGKKTPAPLEALGECNILIEKFKQIREFKKIESYEVKVDEYINKLRALNG